MSVMLAIDPLSAIFSAVVVFGAYIVSYSIYMHRQGMTWWRFELR